MNNKLLGQLASRQRIGKEVQLLSGNFVVQLGEESEESIQRNKA